MHHSQPLFVYYGLLQFTTLFPPFRVFAFATLLLVMASRRTLSSDPEFLLEFMHDLPDESDSDDDFDGYLEPDDGPVAYRREEIFEEQERRLSSSRRSRLLESLAETEQGPPLDTESPLASLSPSPSYSPMQGHNASGSPLAATTLAPRYSGTATGASTGCTAAGSSSLSDTAGGSSLSHTAGGSSSHSRAEPLQAAAPPTLAQMPLQAAAPSTLAQMPLRVSKLKPKVCVIELFSRLLSSSPFHFACP